jgi:hypothetical protein
MEDSSAIQIKLRASPLALFLWFCRPEIQIGETKYRRYWGTHRFEVPPGARLLRIRVPYFGMSLGRAEFPLSIQPNVFLTLRYEPPALLGQPGTIAMER